MKAYRSYEHLLRDISQEGELVDSRIGPTYELLDQSFTFRAGSMVWRRGFSKALGWTELFQLLGGIFDPRTLTMASPKAAATGYFTEQMAYGPRIQPKLARVAEILRKEPNSRRAIIQVAENNNDEPPCTLSIHFLIRNGALKTYVSMRSWDAWLGLPYDIIMFGGLAQAVAEYLAIKAGDVTVRANSLHLYQNHVNREALLSAENIGHFILRHRIPSLDSHYWQWLQTESIDALTTCPWVEDNVPLLNITNSPYV